MKDFSNYSLPMQTSSVAASAGVSTPKTANNQSAQSGAIIQGENNPVNPMGNFSGKKEIKVPEAVEFAEIDFDDNPEAIDFLREEHPNLQSSKNKDGYTKVTYSDDKYEYTLCHGETLVKNKQTGQMQVFYKTETRGIQGLHVVNYNAKGIPESYQRFNMDGTNGSEIVNIDPNDYAQGKRPQLQQLQGMRMEIPGNSGYFIGRNTIDTDN